ncbi:unnamed protein product [Closterium sp. NIES-53]
MYAVTDSAEGDCYLCVPSDPGIQYAALGASESATPITGESALSGTAPTEALHTFTLDSAASRSFFRDSTTLTPLSRPVAVSLADSSGGPSPCALFHGSSVGDDLQDAWVDQFTPGGQRVTHCTCSRTCRHLATFTCRPGSSLYRLTTTSPPVTASGQVAASGQVFAAASRSSPASAPCSCRPLSHETLLWHHRLGHPSLPRLRGMASRTLGHERYFLLVVDDYSRYTTVFPLRRKGEVTEVLIDWIRGTRRQLSESFGSDLPVLRLHPDRGVRCASAQPSASCLLAGDHTYSAVDREGWRCVCVPCLGISSFCSRCFRGQAVLTCPESASVCPPSVGGDCALGTVVLEDRQEEFECFAAAVPHLVSMLLAPEGDPDAPDIPTPCSYAGAIEGPYSS